MIKRKYHHYKLWEDFKHGFYSNCFGAERKDKINSAIELFNNMDLTEKFMLKVIDLWPYSCEQNLTNININKVAYIGQSACCLFDRIPSIVTMEAWKLLDFEVQNRSNNIAKNVINIWEQREKLKLISNYGKNEVINQEYQMRLLPN